MPFAADCKQELNSWNSLPHSSFFTEPSCSNTQRAYNVACLEHLAKISGYFANRSLALATASILHLPRLESSRWFGEVESFSFREESVVYRLGEEYSER